MEAYDKVKYQIENAMKDWEQSQSDLEEAESADE